MGTQGSCPHLPRSCLKRLQLGPVPLRRLPSGLRRLCGVPLTHRKKNPPYLLASRNAAEAKAGGTRSSWERIHYLAEEKFAKCVAQRELRAAIAALARSKHHGKTWRRLPCSVT